MVTAKLIIAFIFTIWIVQLFYFSLNPKFPDSSFLLLLHRPICVGPGLKPHRSFLNYLAHMPNVSASHLGLYCLSMSHKNYASHFSAITQDTPCEATFCPTTEGNKRKIDSYDIGKAEPYMKDLQPNRTTKVIMKGSGTSSIEIPVFVSGLSSNHFYEGLELLEYLNNFVRPKYPTIEIYMFDLGLTANESRQVNLINMLLKRSFAAINFFNIQ